MIIGRILQKSEVDTFLGPKSGLDVVISREEAVWLNEVFKRLYVVHGAELLDKERAQMYEEDPSYQDAVQRQILSGMVEHLTKALDKMSASGRKIVKFFKKPDPRTLGYENRFIVESKLVVLRELPPPPSDSRPERRELATAFSDLWAPNSGLHFPDEFLNWDRFE